MDLIRSFSSDHQPTIERTIDAEAPLQMRGEAIDLVFSLAKDTDGLLAPREIYTVTGLMLTGSITANPYGGYRNRVSRDVCNAHWSRVYDWISRLWREFDRIGFDVPFRTGINKILSANGVVWELVEGGVWERVLPGPLRQTVEAAMAVLTAPEFSAALQLFNLSTAAFNERPRRDRDACCNAYDALESVAKTTLNMPTATFGQVLDKDSQTFNPGLKRVLKGLEVARHTLFGHGGTTAFRLRGAEVDFVYTVCAAGILLYAQ